MLKEISNAVLATKDDFQEALKVNKQTETLINEIVNNERLTKILDEIEEFSKNGTHIIDAKKLSQKIDFELKDYLDAIKKAKAQMDFLKKPFLEVEKLFTLLKNQSKKTIDKKRFELQQIKEQELKEQAIKTIQVEEDGMYKTVEIVDQSALKEIDKTKSLIGFKQERLTNERIYIRDRGALGIALDIIKSKALEGIVKVELDESTIKNNVKEAYLNKDLDKAKQNYLDKGIEIEVVE